MCDTSDDARYNLIALHALTSLRRVFCAGVRQVRALKPHFDAELESLKERRGWGALEGTELRAARAKLLALDALDILNTPEPTDDATPPDSVNDVFVRLRNCIGALENKYPGQEFLVVGGDANVLSMFAAAACGWDLREHGRFTLRPGEFFVLKELQEQVRNGSFVPMALNEPTARDIAEGRRALIEIGPKIFGETGAGSEILDMRR